MPRNSNLDILEAEYAASLKIALARCAGGKWGLLGQNDAALARIGNIAGAHHVSVDVDELLELGSKIDRLRSKLGYSEPFALHARLLKIRSSNHANSLGEPKLARQWLDELSA